MTTNYADALRLSPLDEDLLRIETPARPMHWSILIKLRSEGTRRLTLSELRTRVSTRAAQRDIFSLTVTRRRFRAPVIGVDPGDIAESVVRHTRVHGEAHLRLLLGTMMARFEPTDRLWEITLVDDTISDAQYLILRVHHSLGDGLSASGFAYLFVDGTDKTLSHFDRYLTTPRFTLEPVSNREIASAWRHLAHTWAQGHRAHRPANTRPTMTRQVNYLSVPAAGFNAAARAQHATQTEYLLANVTQALQRLPVGDEVTTMRTMIPMTLDSALAHTGNAMTFALVNLPLTAPTFEAVLTDIRDQITEIAAHKPHYALPTLTQTAAGPWWYKTLASRAILTAVRPNIDVGITPSPLAITAVLGVNVDVVLPFSPLVYTPISIAALLLGGTVSLGITTEAGAVGNLGEALATELADRLSLAPSEVTM